MAEHDPKKQQMEYMAVGLLVLVALFIGISRFKKKETDNEVFSRSKFNKAWKEVENLQSKRPKEEKGVLYGLDDSITPFQSPIKDKREIEIADEGIVLPSMTFQGMIWNSRRPQAIINNKVYDVGDVIEISAGILKDSGYKVKIGDITKDGVYLRYKGKDFLVRSKKTKENLK